jgi:anti-sigma regulatory factor (Ser/Thr protein kinase)
MQREPDPQLRPPDQSDSGASPRHQAVIWRDIADWFEAAVGFIQDGIDRDEPTFVGVAAATGALLREMLDGEPLVDFFDITQLGRNPGRIIAAMLDFAAINKGSPLRYFSEPVWAGRSDAEKAEATRHEALIDVAFADMSATVLCLYDARRLDPLTLSCAEQTHPVIITGGQPRTSRQYAGRGIVPGQCDRPLPPPPASATSLSYRNDLRAVRNRVTSYASQAGLTDGRMADLELAVSEVAANTLRHAGGAGTLRVWHTPDEVVCEVTDPGQIDDPLAGRRRPAHDASRHGLWVVNQLCDLVELRSGPQGTTVRMHISR